MSDAGNPEDDWFEQGRNIGLERHPIGIEIVRYDAITRVGWTRSTFDMAGIIHGSVLRLRSAGFVCRPVCGSYSPK